MDKLVVIKAIFYLELKIMKINQGHMNNRIKDYLEIFRTKTMKLIFYSHLKIFNKMEIVIIMDYSGKSLIIKAYNRIIKIKSLVESFRIKNKNGCIFILFLRTNLEI